MSWNSHDPQANSTYATAQASAFSTRTPLAHHNVSLVYTRSPVPVPHKFTYRTSYLTIVPGSRWNLLQPGTLTHRARTTK